MVKKGNQAGTENTLEIISVKDTLYVDSLNECHDRWDDVNVLKTLKRQQRSE